MKAIRWLARAVGSWLIKWSTTIPISPSCSVVFVRHVSPGDPILLMGARNHEAEVLAILSIEQCWEMMRRLMDAAARNVAAKHRCDTG